MKEYLQHRAVAGERWDQIAWRYYGDAALIRELVTANPEYSAFTRLPAGVIVRVPIIDAAPQRTEMLPPWKR